MDTPELTLQDVEASLQQRLAYLEQEDTIALPSERPEWADWLACYTALAQVKQAQAMERIADLLDGFRKTGKPVENVS